MLLLFNIIAIILVVTVHEFCHALAADRLGDPTPRHLGRLTLNPLAHFDLFGTLALIIFKIGWGKPVPFNPHYLKHPKRDAALISLAGPCANLLTAIIVAVPLKYFAQTPFSGNPLYTLLSVIFWISIVLFSLNVLPLPPLDGSKIIGIFVPARFHYHYEQYLRDGVKYFLIFILLDQFFLVNIFGNSILGTIIFGLAQWIAALISLGT